MRCSEVGAMRVPSVRTVVVPGAVRPEEAEHLAVADLETDVLERYPVTEPLAQAADGQGRGILSRAGRHRSLRAREATGWRPGGVLPGR
jgi:hypothetical protein